MNRFEREQLEALKGIEFKLLEINDAIVDAEIDAIPKVHVVYAKPSLHFQLYSRDGHHEFYREKHGYNCGDEHTICKRSRKCANCDLTEIDMFMGGFVLVQERTMYKIYRRT